MNYSKALHILFIPALCLGLQSAAKGHGGQYAPPYRGPLPTHIGGTGDITISASGSTSKVSWEVWWARNRFQFLDFPDILDNADAIYPITPGPEKEVISAERLDGLDRLAGIRLEAAETIRPLLEHTAFGVRGAAAIGLGMLEDTQALPAITGLLKDGNQWVKDSALLSLGFFQIPKARHLLLHFARNTEAAARAIDQSSVPAYYQGLALVSLTLNRVTGTGALLQDLAVDLQMSMDVRAIALECIGLLGGENHAEFLIQFSRDRKSAPQLAGVAVMAMSRMEDPMVLSTLMAHLHSRHLEVRRSAALGLSRHAQKGDDQAVKALYRAYLHTADQPLRSYSLLSMGLIGGEVAFERLYRTAKMDDDSTCPWACLGLGLTLENDLDRKAGKLLFRVMETHKDRSIRSAAAIALGLAGRHDAIPYLIQTLKDDNDPSLRGYCAMALGMIKDPEALEPLVDALQKDSPPQVRVQAAMALAFMNRNQAVPDMIELLLQTSSAGQKGSVALSLAFMADIRSVSRLLDVLEGGVDDMDPATLSCSVLLISKLLTKRTIPYFESFAANADIVDEFPMKKLLLTFGI